MVNIFWIMKVLELDCMFYAFFYSICHIYDCLCTTKNYMLFVCGKQRFCKSVICNSVLENLTIVYANLIFLLVHLIDLTGDKSLIKYLEQVYNAEQGLR